MEPNKLKTIKSIIEVYDDVVKNVERKAEKDKSRATGGILRSNKGSLVENITESLIRIAWKELGGKEKDITISKTQKEIPIKRGYKKRMKDSSMYDYVFNNFKGLFYNLKVDKHVHINDKFVLAVECKTYTENAMLKRICVDFWFLSKQYPDLSCVLLQLESQLGGDYSEVIEPKTGSKSTHTILSYFPFHLEIITLIKGPREVNQAIHKPGFFKPLEREPLEYALRKFKDILKPHLPK